MNVELIDKMGNDVSVVKAARVSFSSRSTANTYELLNYLAEHGHWCPFAHTSISLRVTAPIFVARQLGKHQVGLAWNEVSRRYVKENVKFYVPPKWRGNPGKVKQGSSRDEIVYFDKSKMQSYAIFPEVSLEIEEYLKGSLVVYNNMIESGVCAEQARMILPLCMYTEWIWTGSIHAFYRVCKLRLEKHAQKETRSVSARIALICMREFPIAWRALWRYSGLKGLKYE